MCRRATRSGSKPQAALRGRAFLLIGLAPLGGLVVTFGNFDDRFAGRCTITVVFEDARTFIRNLRRDGILRYRDREHEGPEDDPSPRFRSRRR